MDQSRVASYVILAAESLEFVAGQNRLLVPDPRPFRDGLSAGVVQLFDGDLTATRQEIDVSTDVRPGGITVARSSPDGSLRSWAKTRGKAYICELTPATSSRRHLFP